MVLIIKINNTNVEICNSEVITLAGIDNINITPIYKKMCHFVCHFFLS